jgi:hypothetical protein
MKWFTEPQGKFVMAIPIEWQYKNVAIGYEEKSPFGFELYENVLGAFQISCYPVNEKTINHSLPIHKADTKGMEFTETKLDDTEFNIHVWFCNVEDHFFMAKYIYDSKEDKNPLIEKELEKVKSVLSTIEFISQPRRDRLVKIDKCEKFTASLAASFDLKNNAIEKRSFIEFVIVVANQIDAYLRLSILLKNQLDNNTDEIDISLLYQAPKDPPVMERTIYSKALKCDIISKDIYDKLEALYQERNKIVHRYIISDLKTRDIRNVAIDYEEICEKARVGMQKLEDLQIEQQIGIYKNSRGSNYEYNAEEIKFMMSQVNDKHLMSSLKREIDPE